MKLISRQIRLPLARALLATGSILSWQAAGLAAQAAQQGAAASPANVARTLDDATPSWPEPVRAPKGAPNVLLVMTDDTGFAASTVFGGAIPRPNLKRLADRGLRYNRFHTTGVCAPSRAALLTGRNAHAVSFGSIGGRGYDGYRAEIPKSAATVARILKDNGYNTAFFGKHHNLPPHEESVAGPFNNWPVGLGFEHFLGFMGGSTSQWNPRLYRGTMPVEPVNLPEGETLDHLLADEAVNWLRNQHAAMPDKPFFIYLAPGTLHSPHQVPPEWIARFKGQFDDGWDALRERTLRQQKKEGLVPANTKLTPRPPEFPAWSSLSPEDQAAHARYMEVAAATVAYQDAQLGRILDEIERAGETDNTLVIFVEGDNGASGEGGDYGVINRVYQMTIGRDETPDMANAVLDQLGGPDSYQNYAAAWGWALNTPFQWVKRVASHLGGVRNGLVVSWPKRITSGGQVRTQFGHLNDIVPTILDAANIQAPAEVDGVPQIKFNGVSLTESFNNPSAPERHTTQYFEVSGDLGIYHEGWFAGTTPVSLPWRNTRVGATGKAPGLLEKEWELYDLRSDFSQANNLARKHPEKLRELQAVFEREALANNVYPLGAHLGADPEHAYPFNPPRTEFSFTGKATSLPLSLAPNFIGNSFTVRADIEPDATGTSGAIIATGSQFGGWAIYLDQGRPTLTHAVSQRANEQYSVQAPTPLPAGRSTIEFRYRTDGKFRQGGSVEILVNGNVAATGTIPETGSILGGWGETFDIGRDTGDPVSKVYSGTFPGEIHKVDVSIDTGTRQASR